MNARGDRPDLKGAHALSDGYDPEETIALLRRELEYYRREHDVIGARMLSLQEDQSRTAREARRSRTLAKLIRDGHRLADRAATSGDVAMMMTAVLLEDMLCDRAAILRRLPGDPRFSIVFSVGLDARPSTGLALDDPPAFCFTTDTTAGGATEQALVRFLDAPYVLWAYHAKSGYAVVIGNKTQQNINRPFEAGDRELIEGALSVFMDVLSRKQQEIALRTAKLQAEQAGRAQTRFIAKLSHELRTPLNAILGFSELLGMADERGMDLKKCAAYGDDIHAAGSYLLALINDILDFTAFGRQAPAIVDRPVELNGLLVEALDTVRLAAERKGLDLSLTPIDPATEVRVDPVRMRQVLLNLLNNAVKFTPAGGRVTVAAMQDAANGAVAIEVTDTGIGMSPERRRKRSRPSSRRRTPSTTPATASGSASPSRRSWSRPTAAPSSWTAPSERASSLGSPCRRGERWRQAPSRLRRGLRLRGRQVWREQIGRCVGERTDILVDGVHQAPNVDVVRRETGAALRLVGGALVDRVRPVGLAGATVVVVVAGGVADQHDQPRQGLQRQHVRPPDRPAREAGEAASIAFGQRPAGEDAGCRLGDQGLAAGVEQLGLRDAMLAEDAEHGRDLQEDDQRGRSRPPAARSSRRRASRPGTGRPRTP